MLSAELEDEGSCCARTANNLERKTQNQHFRAKLFGAFNVSRGPVHSDIWHIAITVGTRRLDLHVHVCHFYSHRQNAENLRDSHGQHDSPQKT